MRKIISKKTGELTDDEIVQIVDGFNASMAHSHIDRNELLKKYEMGHYEYSYHSLCYEDEKLIGFISAIPYLYYYNDEVIRTALTCDIFIREEARADFTLFSQLYKQLKEICLKEGIVCFFGVANNNAYTYSVRILRCKEVMTLNYWILPVKIGNIIKKKWGSALNYLSIVFAFCSLWVNELISFFFNAKVKKTLCGIQSDDSYINKRLPDGRYTNVTIKDALCSYRITEDEGIRCAYIMLAAQNGVRTYKALCRCVAYILHHETVDMIMFNGTLNLRQALLIKTPSRFEPRKLHLTINYLSKDYENKYRGILEPDGLDYSLLDLDVR